MSRFMHAQGRLHCFARGACAQKKKEQKQKKTAPFGVNLMGSHVPNHKMQQRQHPVRHASALIQCSVSKFSQVKAVKLSKHGKTTMPTIDNTAASSLTCIS